MQQSAVPSHVPPELVWNGDLSAFAEAHSDPYVALSEEFHAGPDIRWVTNMMHGRQGWFLTRQDLQTEVFVAPQTFSSRRASDLTEMLGVGWRMIPNEQDPPVHMMYRQVLQPWFQPSAVTRLEEGMRAICRSLLDNFAEKGECDFCEEFGLLFPSQIFLQLMGLPYSLVDQFLAWEHVIVRGETPEARIGALRAVLDYLTTYMMEKRRGPIEDNLASHIATAQVKGRLLTDDEVMGMALVLYVGGLDTVASSVGWYLMHLARNPDLQERLRQNPELIPAAVEELLRAHGVTITMREVMQDLDFHGVEMRAGDIVALPQFLASRDERAFPDPHRIHLDRKARHITLATGPHNCLGAHLARREIKIVLEEWLARFHNIRIPDESAINWQAPGVWGVTRLPLAWDLA